MRISALETQSGISIATGLETTEGLQGILYLDKISDSMQLLGSLDYPLENVYSLDKDRFGLICEMHIPKETRRFLSRIYPNVFIEDDPDIPELILKVFRNNLIPKISINFDFKTGSYEVKAYN